MTREPDELLALCRAARRSEGPSLADRQAIRRRLVAYGLISATVGGLVAKTAVAATSASSASKAAGAGASMVAAAGGMKSTLVVVALYLAGGVAGGMALTAAVRALDADVRSATTRVGVAQKGTPAEPLSRAPRASQPDTSQSPLDAPRPSAPVAVRPPAPVRPAPPRVSSSTTKRAPTLAVEAAGLAEVQRSLRDGNAQRALAVLGALDQRLATGSLDVERQAARILALCAAGRVGEARAQRRQFLTSHESSPLASRVRGTCVDD